MAAAQPGTTDIDLQTAAQFGEAVKRIHDEIRQVIVGQDEVVDELLTALFARGHCLLVGVPGLAKTLLVNSVARVLDLSFKRIQFTPDLMPSDIIGTDIIQEDPDTGRRRFVFVKGPVFANIVLSDEINRAPPKTQSALLEAMQEYKVTAGGTDYRLPLPFFVLATQNPIEQEGTYPLPEAQLDRFMFNILVDYPSQVEERDIVKLTTSAYAPELRKVMSAEEILRLQDLVRRVPAPDHVVDYAVALARATRPRAASVSERTPPAPDFIKEYVTWGAGPRAAQYLIIGGKARALMRGRYFVSCKDVQSVALPVFRHRLVLNFAAEAEGISTDDIVRRLLQAVPTPSE